MNDIVIHADSDIGYGFVPAKYLQPGETEYRFRDSQIDKPLDSYRKLSASEIETLIRNDNRCGDWERILVRHPFEPSLVRNSEFAGLVRIGILERAALEHHDMLIPAGITDSRIISCDIGDHCAIHSCAYIAHYVIGDQCILLNNDEIHVSNHSKFGNGVLKRGEKEDVRVWLDVMNEAGGRSVLPFDGMICADAYLWARRRGDLELMDRFKEMTEAMFDDRRGIYGTIGSGSVLKSNGVIKDARIGESAYVKGANKIKNVTINSSDDERTQIGEGVELVNGIVGYGCRVFYGCKAVRFVMGRCSSLKYGARLIHSVLGDNSTVSCCEILNNLIFPAHEQHHNTSFLIASLVRGQSNMAAGATIGSNHNSRSNDGELEAGRGFWPGLCTSVKHNSRFASYVLLAKGDYRYELDIPFPFSLVSDDQSGDRLEILPAYWWMYNMYALMRNEPKLSTRDKRVIKVQHVEYDPLAPDTIEEIFRSLGLLERYAGESWYARRGEDPKAIPEAGLREKGRELYFASEDGLEGMDLLAGDIENSGRPVIVRKPRRAYKAYRYMIRWYAILALIDYFTDRGDATLLDASEVLSGPREREWDNLGGQLIPVTKLESLVSRVKDGAIGDWNEMHAAYDAHWNEYPIDKARHAWGSLCALLGTETLSEENFARELVRFQGMTRFVEDQVILTRKKDHVNPFRRATCRTEEEILAVYGTPEANAFVRRTKTDMERLRARTDALLTRFALHGFGA